MLANTTYIDTHLYMMTGTGETHRIIDMEAVATCANDLFNHSDCSKEEFLNAILGFHCFTGCDSTSAFAGRAKVKPLVIFGRSNIFIKAFYTLGRSAFIEDELVSSLEMFVCEMYGNRSSDERL